MENNTFLGLQSYTENDTYRFKGRSEESIELYRLIVRNDFTVCYAESGEGKTSLLNAGVFPLLRENMYFPINITFTSDDYRKTPENFDNIIDRCIKDSINDYNGNNKGINVEYKPCCHDFVGMDYQELLQTKLSQYSWWKLRNFKPQAMGLIFTPVFVFDQFEEVFSLPSSIVWTKTFFDWLEEVSSDSCPDDIIKKVRNVIGTEAAFPTINEAKGFKAIFSLRKEFIGELDYWSMQKCFIPALKNNRYCLKALTYEGAKKVMMQKETFDINKIKLILEHLVKQYSRESERTISENLPVIPALLLSVVCDSWERDINYFSNMDAENIAQSLNKILECFYNSAIDKTIEYYKERIEYVDQSLSSYDICCDEIVLRKNIESILFSLVDGNGKRERIKATSSRLSQIGFDENYKKAFWDNRIIKISKIDGEDYVELIHDSLSPVIAQKKEEKFAIEAKKREEQKIYEQARKIRKRMLIISIISVTIVGIIAIVFFQHINWLNTKKSLVVSELLRKSVDRQNEQLNYQIAQNMMQKDSISNLNNSLNGQKDSLMHALDIINNLNNSLNKQLFLNTQKNDSLEHALHIMNRQEDYIKEQSIESSTNEAEREINETNVKKVYDLCLKIRSAYEKSNIDLMMKYNEVFKSYNLSFFNGLKCLDNTETSVKEHFFFNPIYIDSFANGENVSTFSEIETSYRSILRTNDIYIFIKNCCVLANKSTSYSFAAKGQTDLAIITEPGGLVLTRVYDKKHDKWYYDIKEGQSSLYISIDLPRSEISVLELEIINMVSKDISFAILCN